MPVSYIDFIEERLDLGYDYGAVGGHSFATDIVVNKEGEEQRNATRWLPLGRWQLGDRMLYEGDEKGLNEVEYLRQFHADRKGSKQGFRYKDWNDFTATNTYLGTTDGTTKQWQLKKVYYAGTETTLRPILKPVLGTVKVYLDGNLALPAIDGDNGLLTFLVPPDAGKILTADFEFDVPVTFEKDSIDWQLKAAQLESGEYLHKLGSVFVVEMRIDPDLQWYDLATLPQVLSEPLDLGIILDVTEETIFDTRSENLASGFKSSASNRDFSRTLLKLPSRNFTQQELDKILGYFWVAKGRLINFNLKLNSREYLARFNADSLSIKFLDKGGRDLSGLPTSVRCPQGLYQINNLDFYRKMIVPGIIAQCDPTAATDPDAVLVLCGDDFIDKSPLNLFINPHSVQISQNTYSFSAVDSALEISVGQPRAPFQFQGDDFSIEIEANLTYYNPNNSLNFLASQGFYTDHPTNYGNAYLSFYFAISNAQELIFVLKNDQNNIVSLTQSLSDSDFIGSFQRFKVARTGADLKLFYKQTEIVSLNIGSATAIKVVSDRLRFGRTTNGGSQAISIAGALKNIVVLRPGYNP